MEDRPVFPPFPPAPGAWWLADADRGRAARACGTLPPPQERPAEEHAVAPRPSLTRWRLMLSHPPPPGGILGLGSSALGVFAGRAHPKLHGRGPAFAGGAVLPKLHENDALEQPADAHPARGGAARRERCARSTTCPPCTASSCCWRWPTPNLQVRLFNPSAAAAAGFSRVSWPRRTDPRAEPPHACSAVHRRRHDGRGRRAEHRRRAAACSADRRSYHRHGRAGGRRGGAAGAGTHLRRLLEQRAGAPEVEDGGHRRAVACAPMAAQFDDWVGMAAPPPKSVLLPVDVLATRRATSAGSMKAAWACWQTRHRPSTCRPSPPP